MFFSCASKQPVEVPDWYYSTTNQFNRDEYISAKNPIGAKTPEAAIAEATTTLASYIQTNVKSKVDTEYSANQLKTENNSSTTSESSFSQNSSSTVDVDLVALEFTDPWYNPSEKLWYDCAYINAQNAFDRLKPEIEAEKKAFYGFYNKAVEESNDFTKIRYLLEASAQGQTFLTKLAYGSIFADSQVEEEFGQDRTTVLQLSSEIKETKAKSPIYIKVTNDSENTVMSSISETLSKLDFTVTTKQSNASYIAEAVVNYNTEVEGENEEDAMYVLYPDVSIDISAKTGSLAVYSFATSAPKNFSYYKAKAESVACENLAQKVDEEFGTDFSDFLAGNK